MNFQLKSYFNENGLILTLNALACGVHRRIYNFILKKKISNNQEINIHPSASIYGLSHIKFGSCFRAGKHLWLEAVLMDGENQFDPKIIIGDNVIMNENVHIAATNYISIGNDVLMASRIFITDHNHGSYRGEYHSEPNVPPRNRQVSSNGRVIIEDNVWIGEMVSVMPGVVIGYGSVIGGNSIVTENIPPYSIAVGNPAKVIKKFDYSLRKWVPVSS